MKLDNVVTSLVSPSVPKYVPKPGPFAPKLDMLPDVFEVDDQLSVGSCTANASTSEIERRKKVSLSRLFPYYNTRLMENRVGQEGAMLIDAIRSLEISGTPLETIWPYLVPNVNVKPSDAAYAAATDNRILAWQQLELGNPLTWEGQQKTIDTLKSAMTDGYGVVFASHVGKDIQTLTGPWQSHKMRPAALGIYANNGNEWIGNHAILCIGWDDTIVSPCPGWNMDGSFLIQGSWGKGYGDGGFNAYPFQALVCDLMEAFVITKIAGVDDQNYVTPPAVILEMYRILWRLDIVAVGVTHPDVIYWSQQPGGLRSMLTSYKTVIDQIIIEKLASLP